MSVLVFMVPLAIALGLIGLAGFLWALHNGQFDDPDGSASRILLDDDGPLP
ncbi:MAG: cbb3-type cytochrome oxidase assembly protein CcoS [Alphaproteobacteria bacterium]